MSVAKKAWGALLADITARGRLNFGGMGYGGALPPGDRRMPPRMSDYGAGYYGEGLEATARLSEVGQQYFNRTFHCGRAWSGGREDF